MVLRFRRRLVCHHCGYSVPLPEQCPKCQAKGSFVAVGPGVESLRPGDHVVAPTVMYWGLRNWLVEFCRRWGIALDLYDIGEIPPLGHVPDRMWAWTIKEPAERAAE